MTNKEKLNVAIQQDINPTNNYNEIIKKIEKEVKMKNKNSICKWSLVPICLVVIISGILILNYQNKKILKDDNCGNKENNMCLKINNINKTLTSIDIAGSAIDLTIDELIKEEEFIADFKILSSLNQSRLMKRYDINNEFIGYDLMYYSIDNNNQINKEIEVFLSKTLKNKPNCYETIIFDELENSKINNTIVKILKEENNNNYYVLFRYNDYNFDIETTNITEQELLTFLLSILK